MTRPQRRKDGTYYARKGVPAALRTVAGRRELIASLRTKDAKEALRLFPEAIAKFDATLAALRAQLSGQARRPTPRQIAELAGAVYREQVAFAEEAPGTFEDRSIGVELLRGELDYSPGPRRLREAGFILREGGFAADPETLDAMARAVVRARLDAEGRASYLADGDWTPETAGIRYPLPPERPEAPPAAPVAAPNALTFDALIDLFALENRGPPKTLDKRKRALVRLRVAAGHDDARRVTKADVRAMKTKRLADGRDPATANDDIATLRPVWTWALRNDLLTGDNPFTGMSIRAEYNAPSKRDPFPEKDAVTILTAARSAKGFLRWLPWVLAFTGCRLDEACGAAREDVRIERGVWCLALHTGAPGRSLKNAQSQRMIPLHPALIAEGFRDYAQALPAGSPLFPDVAVGSYGKRSATATKRLGPWVRGLGITDPKLAPAHSWRHWLPDELRKTGCPREMVDAIMGHKNATNAGDRYGQGFRAWPDKLLVELAKVSSPLEPSEQLAKAP